MRIPACRVVRLLALAFRLQRDPETTAVRWPAKQGIAPESTHHIMLTLLHFDCAGELPGLPHAPVHVHRREHQAFLGPRLWIELGYDRADAAYGSRWVLHDQLDTD